MSPDVAAGSTNRIIRVSALGPDNPFVPFTADEAEQTIVQRFEKTVRQHSDRIAVKLGDTVLTYDELNRQANRMSRALLAQGLPLDRPIAILMGHNIGPIIAILGALKARIIYTVLDPSMPREMLASIVHDAHAAVLVSDSTMSALGRAVSGQAIPILNIDDLDQGLPAHNLELHAGPDEITCIIYTSGSSGKPKGVMNSHRSRLGTVRRFTNDLRICPDDRHSFVTRYAHTAGAAGLFRCLLNGATLLPFDVRGEGFDAMPAWLAREGVTILHAAPTVFRRMATSVTAQHDVSHMRVIHLTGEPVLRSDVTLYQMTFPPSCRLVGVYGSSEGGATCRGWIDHSTDASDGILPAGYAYDGVSVRCLDSSGRDVPRGSIGEVAISSDCVASGYWQQPELTSRRFVSSSGSRYYLSGDLGFILEDGCLVLCGRADLQVKIRGLTVDVPEVEAALLALGDAKEACVAARVDVDGNNILVAYMVPAGPPPAVDALRRRLAAQLQEHMIPARYIFLEALPLTASNKVDRRALPEISHERPHLEKALVAPRTPNEQTLCDIWKDVLRIRDVGIHDDFFDLGGDSLRAAQVVARANVHFAASVALADFFQSPTVAAMALAITQALAGQAGAADIERLLALSSGLDNPE